MTGAINSGKHWRLIAVTLLLLLIFASRTHVLNQMQFHQDEARSALRMMGTPAQIIAWQPPDWPPLHNLMLGFWQMFAGPLPLSLRSLSVFIFMIGAAITYRAADRLFADRKAAWGTTLAYAALGYSVFLSTFIRAYVLDMTLYALALWLILRYFHRPGWRRALPLGITLAAAFYASYTAVLAFLILGIYTLLIAPRAVWRWWQPAAVLVLLVSPELIGKSDFFTGRVSSAATIFPDIDPLPEALRKVFQDYFGQADALWLALVVIAIIVAFTAPRAPRRVLLWIWGSIVAGPVSLYILAAIPIVYFFEARYTWWALLMIALGLGYGLTRLPRPAWLAVSGVLVVLMFTIPVNVRYKPSHQRPFEQNFRWLQQRIQPGDVMLIDPQFCIQRCNEEDSWGYYFEVYLRSRLRVVTEPGPYRRIWYVSADGWNDPATEAALLENHIPSIFVGPWDFLIRLYEGPPDPAGVPFENGLRFHGFDIMTGDIIEQPRYYWREQTSGWVRLWWSVDQPLENDYSISLQLINTRSGNLLAQNDGAPQLVQLDPVDATPLPSETSRWEPGRYYVDVREIPIRNLGAEIYAQLYLTVYQWWDGIRLSAPGVNADNLLPLTPVLIWGWG